ncbi:hypothetical protein AB0M43_39125 [Longispora sp. NPDC051575]|uniref:hypothetical protein n=1 Tax=Longispora sp. NPDC051575 TaxID=3154943 RepID=UPI0034392C09
MSQSQENAADRYLFYSSVVADVIGILAFVGLSAAGAWRWIITGILAFLGFAAALTAVRPIVGLWLSPRGRYYPAGYHRRRLAMAATALLVSLALAFGAFTVYKSPPVQPKQPQPTTNSSPR